MSHLYVIGGQQRRARSVLEGNEPGWYKYHKGMILHVDTDLNQSEMLVEYVSPANVCADYEPAILFKCATLQGDKLYACTQTEILIYSVPDFRLLTYLSLPCFNDLHHVRSAPQGTLLVANAGLDMVLEVTLDGDVLREWNTLGEDPWGRFDKQIDYRRVESTKPHRSHPNQVFFVGDDVWVTRFEQRDALCLTDPSKRIAIASEPVHDGLVQGDLAYFTTVSGRIVIANIRTCSIEEIIDLNGMDASGDILGWCRGIQVDDGRAWVGFSRLRLTKFRENVSWVRWGFRPHLPTRVACYDLVRKCRLTEIDVQAHGLDAVFSIFSADPAETIPELGDNQSQRHALAGQ